MFSISESNDQSNPLYRITHNSVYDPKIPWALQLFLHSFLGVAGAASVDLQFQLVSFVPHQLSISVEKSLWVKQASRYTIHSHSLLLNTILSPTLLPNTINSPTLLTDTIHSHTLLPNTIHNHTLLLNTIHNHTLLPNTIHSPTLLTDISIVPHY